MGNTMKKYKTEIAIFGKKFRGTVKAASADEAKTISKNWLINQAAIYVDSSDFEKPEPSHQEPDWNFNDLFQSLNLTEK